VNDSWNWAKGLAPAKEDRISLQITYSQLNPTGAGHGGEIGQKTRQSELGMNA